MRLKIIALISLACFLPISALAAVPRYTLSETKSSLKFTAIQNGAPVQGAFNHFSGDIAFDPANLNDSSIVAKVDVASASAAYEEVSKNLLTADWLDAVKFPQATLKTISITKTGGADNQYYADAELTIRDKTLPVQVNFIVEKLTPELAIANGRISILRSKFGVGQGEWKKTDVVQDNVDITFRAVAEKAK